MVTTGENPCGIMDNALIGDLQRCIGNGNRERRSGGFVEKMPDAIGSLGFSRVLLSFPHQQGRWEKQSKTHKNLREGRRAPRPSRRAAVPQTPWV
jgi:hypothetical protein